MKKTITSVDAASLCVTSQALNPDKSAVDMKSKDCDAYRIKPFTPFAISMGQTNPEPESHLRHFKNKESGDL